MALRILQDHNKIVGICIQESLNALGNYNSKLNTKQAITKSALHANNWALPKKFEKERKQAWFKASHHQPLLFITLRHAYLRVEWFTYSIQAVSKIYQTKHGNIFLSWTQLPFIE